MDSTGIAHDFINNDIAFPADKQEIIDHAKRRHLPNEVMSALDRLPNRMFREPMDVLQTLII